jgi:hypothetical protein
VAAKQWVLLIVLPLLTAGCVVTFPGDDGEQIVERSRNTNVSNNIGGHNLTGESETLIEHPFTLAGEFSEAVELNVPDGVKLLRVNVLSDGVWHVQNPFSFSGAGTCKTTGGMGNGVGSVSSGMGSGNGIAQGECTHPEAGTHTFTASAEAVGEFILTVEAFW